ncbi:MAG: YceI family protein [Candidatus Aquilonibacter sp.]
MHNLLLALLLAVTWSADPVHSSANFTVVHLGISHVNGIIPIKSSNIDVPEGSNIPASATAEFDPSGLDTRNNDRDADLRSPHFFEVATYPVMSFKSTKITATDATHFTMTGDLTLHGQTHPVTLDAQYLGRATTPNGQQRIAFEAKTTIDRTQWGMTYGNPFAGNSVDIELDIEAVKR